MKMSLENQHRMLSGRGSNSNSLLQQMGGGFTNDEDEQMLADILGELGGGGFEKGQRLNIRSLFQITLS